MSFSKQIKGYTTVYEKRLRAVAREATQATLEEAQTVRALGGGMRVDTGFLRASLVAQVGSMPSGQSVNPGKVTFTDGSVLSGEPLAASLLKWDPNKGQTFYAGWSANYARPREYKDGFLRGATQNWGAHVEKAAKKALQIK